MSGQQYSVEISVGVIEKLAGLKKPPQKQSLGAGPSSSPFSYGNPEVATLSKTDAALSKALAVSRRVGSLLLKAEEAEVATVKRYSEDLLSKHSFPVKDEPCGSQRDAAVGCYEANPGDTLKCSAQVKAYEACSAAAYNAYVKRVNSERRP
ncbi:hypothetical protein FOA52_002137 [Chlamydomonas sp. UWO 241]|nr:hypothetical protein FOA52_002137 [Chlamydomonas sp. UWO 241]